MYFSSMGIKVGQYPNTFFSFAGIPLANVVNRNQLAPDSGLVTYSFDVLAGNTDYACFSAGVETLTFGPSTFTLNVVVTPLP